MKNKFIPLLLSASLMIAFPCSSYATEIVEPEKPNINNEQQVNEYNKQVDEYNQQIDYIYNQELEEYNKAIEYNKQEEQRVNQINKEQEEITNQHNIEEDNKVQQNEKDLKQYEEDLQKYEEEINSPQYIADKKNAETVLKYYDSIAEYNMLPFKSGDEAEFKEIYTNNSVDRRIVRQENKNLEDLDFSSTIKVKEAEEKSGETYTVIVTHFFVNSNYQNIATFSFEQEVDVNDTITVKSLADNVSSKLVLSNDDKYGIFYTYIDDKYLSSYWYQSFGYAEYTRLKEKNDFTEYQLNGTAYDFTLKNGSYYYSDLPYFEAQYYYVNWLTINEVIDPIKPKEVIKYIPDYWTVKYITPNYLTVIPPVKGKYLTKLTFIPIQQEQNPAAPVIKTSTTTATTPVLATTKTITPSKAPTTTVVKNQIPLSLPKKEVGSWALLNLIATICSIILAILSFVLFFFNRKKTKEDKENEEYTIKKKRFLRRIVEIVISLAMIIIFILTEDTSLPMVWTDKYTILMLLLLLIHIIVIIIFRRKEKENKEDKGEY